jgi:hypothetical protein
MRSKFWSNVLLTAAVLALTIPAAIAQSASKTGPKYDSASEAKIKGVVEDIREPGGLEPTLLLVKTESKTVLVYVAPAAFLKEIETSFSKGDQVEVVGCKSLNGSDEEILAREITDGSNTFTLRDDKGVPIWAGWKPAKASGK